MAQHQFPDGYKSLDEFIADNPRGNPHQEYDIPYAHPLRFTHNGVDYQLGHGRIMVQRKEQFDGSSVFEPTEVFFRVFASEIDPAIGFNVEDGPSKKFDEYLDAAGNKGSVNFFPTDDSANLPVDVTVAPHLFGYWMAGIEKDERHLTEGNKDSPKGYSIYLDGDDIVLHKTGEGQARFAMHD